jgi:hypothetical protein
MNRTIPALLLLCALTAAKAPERFYANKKRKTEFTRVSHQRDSSNYSLSVVKENVDYAQMRFSIISKENSPDDGIIYLLDNNGKPISGLITEKSGKIVVLVWDDKVKSVLVTQIGLGRVIIPIAKVKNKVVDIKVQLHPISIID